VLWIQPKDCISWFPLQIELVNQKHAEVLGGDLGNSLRGAESHITTFPSLHFPPFFYFPGMWHDD
jgi:hypothetical protein